MAQNIYSYTYLLYYKVAFANITYVHSFGSLTRKQQGGFILCILNVYVQNQKYMQKQLHILQLLVNSK